MRPDKEIIFTAKVVVKPEFELGEYKGDKAEKAVYETTDENVNEEIEKLRERNSRLVLWKTELFRLMILLTLILRALLMTLHLMGGKGENFDLTIGSGQFSRLRIIAR